MPAPDDAVRRVGVVVEHGRLRPERGVPRPPLHARKSPEQRGVVDVAGKSPYGRGRVGVVQHEQAVEHRRPAPLGLRQRLGADAEVDRQPYPGRALLVVAEHAVHHRDGIRGPGQIRRDRPARALPAGPEALPGPDHVVEPTGERIHDQPTRQGKVVLVPVERQGRERLRVCGGTGQIARGQADLGRHEVAVADLEPGQRADRDRVEQLEPAAGDPRRPRDVVVDQAGKGQQVKGDAPQYPVTGPIGQPGDPPGLADRGLVPELGNRERRPDDRRSVGERAGLGQQRVGLRGRVLAGHDPRGPVHVHRHGRQVEGRAGRIAGLDRLVRRRPEQPQGLVAGEPAGGRAGGQPQVADPSGARRRQLGRLLVAPLCLRRPAAREQQPGQPGGQLGRGRPALLVARRPGERRGDVVGDPVEPGAPGLVDVAGIGPAELRDGVPAPPLVAGPDPVKLAGGNQLLDAVLANRLQRAIPGRLTAPDEQQAVLGEAGQAVGDLGALAPVAGHGAGGVDVEPGREHGDPTQQRAIVGREQVVAPADGRPQRGVPVDPATAGGQHPQPLVQPRLEAVESERRKTGGGQLDGQRDAVQRPAQRRHPAGVRCG